jgi:hypothetical protein
VNWIERDPWFALGVGCGADVFLATNRVAIAVIQPSIEIVIAFSVSGVFPDDAEPVVHGIELDVRIRLTIRCAADGNDVAKR